jgi:hypothetical protein
MPGGQMLQSKPIRRFSTQLGSEAIRVGQAHGYQLEEVLHPPPETIARAGEGDEAAMRACWPHAHTSTVTARWVPGCSRQVLKLQSKIARRSSNRLDQFLMTIDGADRQSFVGLSKFHVPRVLIPLDVAHHSGMISPTVPI